MTIRRNGKKLEITIYNGLYLINYINLFRFNFIEFYHFLRNGRLKKNRYFRNVRVHEVGNSKERRAKDRDSELINCKESPFAGEQPSESQSGRATRRGGEHERLPDDVGVLRLVAHRVAIRVIDQRVEALINQLAGYHGEGWSNGDIVHDKNGIEREPIDRVIVRVERLLFV